MIQAIVINPTSKTVADLTAPTTKRELEAHLKCRLIKTHVFPNGDFLLSARDHSAEENFKLGKSEPLSGVAIVVGRHNSLLRSTRYSATTIASLVAWHSPT